MYVKKSKLKLPQEGLRWMDLRGAAAYLSCSIQSVRRAIHRGEIKAVVMFGHLTVDRNDLDEMMTRNKKVLPPFRQGTRPAVAERHAKARQVAR